MTTSIAGSQTAQPAGSCTGALRVASYGQQEVSMREAYLFAEVHSVYSTALADRAGVSLLIVPLLLSLLFFLLLYSFFFFTIELSIVYSNSNNNKNQRKVFPVKL